MRTSIEFKLIPITIIGILMVGLVFGYVFMNTQKDTLDAIYLKEIQSAQKTFYNLEENDGKMLRAAMTDMFTNDNIRNVFMSNDRDKLYNVTKDLYAEHKKLGITHFYFETLDGKVFLRVHSKAKFGDNVGRVTYANSVATKDWASGIELGKTAFALRVVHPYYNGSDLIGYIEYGEEIDHFIQQMKIQTNDDFATIVTKSSIDPTYWEGVRKGKNLPNNYNDYNDYVMVDSTNEAQVKQGACWTEELVRSVSVEGNIFKKYTENGKTYICGGFSLLDAADKNIGAIIVMKDVTADESASLKSIQNAGLITVLMILLISGVLMILIKTMVVNPIKKLTSAGNKINEGDIDAALPEIKSNDEIKELSDVMTSLVGAIKFLKQEQMAKAPAKKTASKKK